MMPAVSYSLFHSLIQKAAATRPGSWIMSRILPPLDAFVLRLSRGRYTLTGLLAGVPVLFVTTTGARSGLPRTSPLLPVWHPSVPGGFAIIASNWGQHHLPAWYFNLKKNPLALCVIGGKEQTYDALEASDPDYERIWQQAVDTYFGYGLYRQRAGRRIPIMILTPAEASSTQKPSE